MSGTRKRYTRSWVGFEEERAQVRRLATEIVASDTAAREVYEDSCATGLICATMRDPSFVTDDVITRAAKAQEELAHLNERLVHTHHLCLDFVRRESALIIDPSDATRRIYDALLRTKPPVII